MDMGEPLKRTTVVPLKNPVPESAPEPEMPSVPEQAPSEPEKVPA